MNDADALHDEKGRGSGEDVDFQVGDGLERRCLSFNCTLGRYVKNRSGISHHPACFTVEVLVRGLSSNHHDCRFDDLFNFRAPQRFNRTS